MSAHPRIVHLQGGGTSVAVTVDQRGPRILHWGRALTEADVAALAATDLPVVAASSYDLPRVLPLVPTGGDGWAGTPGLAWHRGGEFAVPHLVLRHIDQQDGAARFVFDDARASATVDLELRVDGHGVMTSRVTVTAGPGLVPLDLVAVRVTLPLPARATEMLDFTGRWTHERAPQRAPLRDGAHARVQRRGRTGHDSPYLTVVGTPGFSFRAGDVWAAHVAWSGNQEVLVEMLPERAGVHGATIVAGEALAPGEVRLGPGESYSSPWVVATWSDAGLDGMSARLHGHVRALAAHPTTPRPLTLNVWEAVYFDHDPAVIMELATLARDVGVERFVLDDGWFVGRTSDRAGLGDWFVDPQKWPDGLRGLFDHVRALGMECGLWFEPEMVNPDSELARAHPDWVLGGDGRPGTWRHQQVLDLSNPDVFAYLEERLATLINEWGIDYIKWDHNRDLDAAASGTSGRVSVHAQTLAAYRLMETLRARFPLLEIESCSSGGARVDLGVLAHAQRVWVSDTNDPGERQLIERWTGLLLPPEVMGSHVGPKWAHTTHRAATLGFRMLTALFGHAGLEWDLRECSPDERDRLRRWAALYKDLRPLLHGGVTVRGDFVDAGAMVCGVVAPDLSRAIYAYIRLDTSPLASSPRTAFPGLDPHATYRLRVRDDLGDVSRHHVSDPAWMADGTLEVTGRVLSELGLPLPLLNPGSGLLLEAVRVDGAGGAGGRVDVGAALVGNGVK